VSESYAGQQIVGIDLHRRRSVIVRMTETGEHLETVRIVNDQERLAAVMAAAGESPEVVLEATYGWYWAADALADLGPLTPCPPRGEGMTDSPRRTPGGGLSAAGEFGPGARTRPSDPSPDQEAHRTPLPPPAEQQAPRA